MTIRLANQEDADIIWAILEPTIRAGETYTLPRDMTRAAALDYWLGSAHKYLLRRWMALYSGRTSCKRTRTAAARTWPIAGS